MTAGAIEYRTLGGSGASVSSLALGTMTFGNETDEAGAHAQLDRFVEAGGTLVDTADVYTAGASEQIIGRWLAGRPADVRSRVVLASSLVGGRLVLTVDDDGPGLPDEVRQQAFTRGTRLDETVPGNGLGLATVRDLANLYGGRVHLEASGLGGLRARLELSAALGSQAIL